MATIKAILKKDKRKDGSYPLAIRITKEGKSTFIYLDYSIHPEYWDDAKQRVKKSFPNSVRLNNLIAKRLSEAGDKAIELETNKQIVSSKAIKNKILPTSKDTFFGQAESYLNTLFAGGKYNQYTSDKPRIKHFREFLKGDDVAFSDITVGLMERFKAYCKGSLELSERSAVNHLAMVRSVFAEARKNEVIDDKTTPFGKGKMSIKFPDSKKIGLNREEISRLEVVELPSDAHDHARNLWLFSYYMAGMRISDVFRLTWSDIKDGRLHYVMGKNDKGDSIKMPQQAIAITEKYRQFKDNTDLIFPDLKNTAKADKFKLERQIAFCASRYDKFLNKKVAPLCNIDKKLTMHIARHSFGQLANGKADIRVLQKLYRHSKLETTLGYQSNFDHDQADSALDTILNP